MSFTFDTSAVDEFEEMVSYRKDVTGIDCTVFISPRGIARHSPRILDSVSTREATSQPLHLMGP